MTLSDEQRKAMFANLGKGKPKKKTKLKRPKTGKTSKVQRWQPKGYTGIGLVRKKALEEMKRTPIKRTKLKHLHLGSDSMDAQIRGQTDGSQIGKKSGGGGRNETSNCRHPEKKQQTLKGTTIWKVQYEPREQIIRKNLTAKARKKWDSSSEIKKIGIIDRLESKGFFKKKILKRKKPQKE